MDQYLPPQSQSPMDLMTILKLLQSMIGQTRTQEGNVQLTQGQGVPIPPMQRDVGDLVDYMNETGGPLKGLFGGGIENPAPSRRRGI